MPVYSYRCVECGNIETKVHGMAKNPMFECPQPECGGLMQRLVTGGSGSYMKGITASKYSKEERQRSKKRAHLELKQYERYGGKNKLVPNFEGKEVSSWKEAESLAIQRGESNTESFKKHIDVEEHSKNSAGLDERRYRELKNKAAKA